MLPKTAEYALRATVWLGRSPQTPLAAGPLAQAIQVPRRYLHKVLQDLVKAGIVRSQPGPGGGYSLVGDPHRIALLDVINAVGQFQRIDHCPVGLVSHTSLCPLHRELDQAYAGMEAAFARVTIAQVIEQPGEAAPLCDANRDSRA